MSFEKNLNTQIFLNTSLKHFPFSNFHKFCNVIYDVWEQIAAKIRNRSKTALKFTNDDICTFRRSKNPAEEMMNAWKMDNPKFTDLILLLEEEQLWRALTFLEENVLESKQNKSNISINLTNKCDSNRNQIYDIKKEEMKTHSYNIDYKSLNEWTNNFNTQDHLHGGNFINSGGFADVFMGLKDGGRVAVKRFKQKDQQQQFHNETVLFDCNHANLVKLLYICDDGPSWCLVYEFVQNGSLYDCLCDPKRVSALGTETRVKVARQTALALEYLHHKDIVHRDIKSANILLTNADEVKIGDFGICKVLHLSGHTHVKTMTIVGTALYMAPEYLFHQHVSPSIDMYSFGVVLLELYYGQPAYSDDRAIQSIVEMYEDEVEMDGCWRGTDMEEVVEVVRAYLPRLLNRKKHNRPTAPETVKALSHLQQLL